MFSEKATKIFVKFIFPMKIPVQLKYNVNFEVQSDKQYKCDLPVFAQ